MLPGTYTAFAPIGRFQMLSREKGQRVATRPVADAEAEEVVGGLRTKGPSLRIANEPATRIPVRRSARTRKGLPLRFDATSSARRMRVARECGMRVTVGGWVVTPRCVYRGDCTSIESGSRVSEQERLLCRASAVRFQCKSERRVARKVEKIGSIPAPEAGPRDCKNTR